MQLPVCIAAWPRPRGIARIDQHGNPNGFGHQIVQEPQPLGRNLLGEEIDAGRVAARPGKTGDETQLDRVFGDDEDDWDRRGRSFCRLTTAVGWLRRLPPPAPRRDRP